MTPKQPRTAAAVEEHDIAPVGVDTDVLLAENEKQMVKTVERTTGEDGTPVTTTHTRPGTKIMYKPFAGGYMPKTVSRSSLGLLIRQGWKEFCPDCKGEHLDKQGQASTDPNLCSARDPVAVRVCPVCDKRIYDNVRFSEEAGDAGDDVNVIREAAYENSTGASRTKISLDRHLWERHERQAQMMNVPLPAGWREKAAEKPA